MRRWIQFCSLGLGIAVFAWINLDVWPRPMDDWFPKPSALARLGEALVAFPFAMLGGTILGALVGAIALMPIDAVRWIWHRLRRDHRNTSA